MDYKQIIADSIKADGFTADQLKAFIMIPPDKSFGDYSFPCFKICKAFKKSPKDTAELILKSAFDESAFDKVEAVNGYLNFYVKKDGFARDVLSEILSQKANYGGSDIGSGKTVCIDYSSINIAKPFHMGHLSTTAIGAALCRIYKHLGFTVVGINHLGDYGTQFGKLIVAYKKWSSEEQIKQGRIDEMLRIYVKFHEEAEKDESLNDLARSYFKKIEDNDPDSVGIFQLFKEMTLTEVEKIYKRLNVQFDSYAGESFYNDKMQPVLDELAAKNLLVESKGAKVVDLEAYAMPPCLLVKADGATLYATRDIAAAFYRKKTYDFYKCLYVVAYQQNLHFQQFFKVIELMGHGWAKGLEHVAFGMVSLEDGGAMSTRKGNLLRLEEVLDKCVQKAYDIISEKNPDMPDREGVAETVGVGAVVFSALINSRIKDIVFSYDRVLNFEGETGPYIQYTCVRAKSVLKKADAPDISGISLDGLNDYEFELIKSLESYKQTLLDVIDKNEPSYLTRLLVDISRSFNKFYYECKILGSDKQTSERRLVITKAALTVLEKGLSLLGIGVPDSM